MGNPAPSMMFPRGQVYFTWEARVTGTSIVIPGAARLRILESSS
jgi:hypothetical protein